MKNLISATTIIIGISISILAASKAQAYSLNPNLSCSSGLVTGSIQCAGSYTLGNGENDVTDGGTNNIATKILNDNNIFGNADWTFGNKLNVGTTSPINSNTHGFSLRPSSNNTSGNFSFSNLDLSKTDLAISLKSAKGFSLYYIKAGSVANLSQIQWNTAGTSVNNKGAAQGLSHISYYTRLVSIAPPPVKKVPEPAAIAALATVGGMTFLRRKKQPIG